MGLMDHTKTWTFETRLTPDECAQFFVETLRGSTMMALMKANWTFSEHRSTDTVRIVATYEGRGGLAGAVSSLSARSQSESDAARGSQITFEAGPRDPNGSECSMWMNTSSKIWIFFTADARFFRSYMTKVGRRLRTADPAAQLVKS
jgi:hypothetical protein